MDAMTSKRSARPEEPTKVPAAEPRIHSLAVVEPGARIGPRTRIWAFAHVLPGAVVGADCNLCDHTFVEGAVRIGDRVTVKCGVYLWDGVTLEDDVFVGPCAAFTNDKFPRSRRRPARYLQTVVGQGASIGANATLLPGVRIGKQAMVGAGAVVTRDVPAYAVVKGNPARLAGYGDAAVPADRPAAAPRKRRAKSAGTLSGATSVAANGSGGGNGTVAQPAPQRQTASNAAVSQRFMPRPLPERHPVG